MPTLQRVQSSKERVERGPLSQQGRSRRHGQRLRQPAARSHSSGPSSGSGWGSVGPAWPSVGLEHGTGLAHVP